MNRKGGVLGQALTSPFTMIIVFLFSLVFIIVSGAIADSHENSENLLDNFLNDYVVYKGNVLTVKELIESTDVCSKGIVSKEIRAALRDNFRENYGGGDSFALVNDLISKQKIYSWYGFNADKYNLEEFEVSNDEFNSLFDTDSEFVRVKPICNTALYIYTRSDS